MQRPSMIIKTSRIYCSLGLWLESQGCHSRDKFTRSYQVKGFNIAQKEKDFPKLEFWRSWFEKIRRTAKLLLELVIELVYITKVWAQRSYIDINRDNNILLAGQTTSSWARTLIHSVLHTNTVHLVLCWAHNDHQE